MTTQHQNQLAQNIEQKGTEFLPGLWVSQTPEVDTITWSNRHIPRHQALYFSFIAAFSISLSLSLFLTISLLRDLSFTSGPVFISPIELGISLIFIVLCWICVLFTSYYLISISWTETIRISDETIQICYSGLFSPKNKVIEANRIWCLAFERIGNERDQEPRFTLNLFDIDDRRQLLAYWIKTEENFKLFLLLEKIFDQRHWDLQNRTSYSKN